MKVGKLKGWLKVAHLDILDELRSAVLSLVARICDIVHITLG